MSTLAELKQRLEAARVERERREKETREQEERELQRLVEEERREEEECARREQQRADEEVKRADEGRVTEEVRERVEEEQVAEGQQNTTDVGGEGSKETETTAGLTETAGESWETDIARLHVAAWQVVPKTTERVTMQRKTHAGTAGIRNWCVSVLSKFFFFLIPLFASC